MCHCDIGGTVFSPQARVSGESSSHQCNPAHYNIFYQSASLKVCQQPADDRGFPPRWSLWVLPAIMLIVSVYMHMKINYS